MRILIVSPIDSSAIRALEQEHDVVCAFNAPEEELKKRIIDRDVVVFRSGVDLSTKVLDCGPELKLMLRAGCGVDNLDLDYVWRSAALTDVAISPPSYDCGG